MQAKADEYVAGGFRDNGSVIPSIEGLAMHLGTVRRTLYDWRDKGHVDFLHTLDSIEEKQKNITLNEGLKGEFNATIAKLVLANHGMHDKQDTTSTVNLSVEGDIDSVCE